MAQTLKIMNYEQSIETGCPEPCQAKTISDYFSD
jgi:hypothetical protein